MKRLLLKAIVMVLSLLTVTAAPSPLQAQTVAGYALVSPGPGVDTATGLTGIRVYETFGFKEDNFSSQSETAAAQMTTTALLFVNISKANNRDTGICITNPGSSGGVVTMTLKNELGITASIKSLVMSSSQQITQFVSELFASQGISDEFTGTLSFSSTVPVAIVALRFSGQSFTMEEISNLSPATPAGLAGSLVIPNFVTGGGWGTQLIFVNTRATPTSVRVDLFTSNGSRMTATLNGTTGTTFFAPLIEGFGVEIIGPSNSPF